ncbi:MAG: hypothetical protein LUH05_09070, partial [Candidatus Gastranaerophilales bacterium]|nr:hypothetical protein [Candidatus Gastranaerophilales bacterium]
NLNIKLKIFLNNRQKYLPTFYAINTEQFSNFDFLCSNDKLGEQYPQIRLLSDLAIAAEELYQDW